MYKLKAEVRKLNTVFGFLKEVPEIGDKLIVYNKTGEQILCTSRITEVVRDECSDGIIRFYTLRSVYELYTPELDLTPEEA